MAESSSAGPDKIGDAEHACVIDHRELVACVEGDVLRLVSLRT